MYFESASQTVPDSHSQEIFNQREYYIVQRDLSNGMAIFQLNTGWKNLANKTLQLRYSKTMVYVSEYLPICI